MKVKCSATKCIFNNNQECFNKNITIQGLFSNCKLGTFCESYIRKEESTDKLEKRLSRVSCNANLCKHLKNGYCICKELTIWGDNANYRSETQCNSFELKYGGKTR